MPVLSLRLVTLLHAFVLVTQAVRGEFLGNDLTSGVWVKTVLLWRPHRDGVAASGFSSPAEAARLAEEVNGAGRSVATRRPQQSQSLHSALERSTPADSKGSHMGRNTVRSSRAMCSNPTSKATHHRRSQIQTQDIHTRESGHSHSRRNRGGHSLGGSRRESLRHLLGSRHRLRAR